jgi:predicted naringenin-chalcone synthase
MYRDIKINGVNYRADLGILVDHRITITDGKVLVSADLDGRTQGALFEATFTGRGDTRVLIAPEEYVIGDATLEEGDDVKIARAAKLPAIFAELDALDQKLIRPTAAIVAATASGEEAPAAEVAKIAELEQRKAALRAAITAINAAATVEAVVAAVI